MSDAKIAIDFLTGMTFGRLSKGQAQAIAVQRNLSAKEQAPYNGKLGQIADKIDSWNPLHRYSGTVAAGQVGTSK